MRAFVRIRELLGSNTELTDQLDQLERKLQSHDETIIGILKAIREHMRQPHPKNTSCAYSFACGNSSAPTGRWPAALQNWSRDAVG